MLCSEGEPMLVCDWTMWIEGDPSIVCELSYTERIIQSMSGCLSQKHKRRDQTNHSNLLYLVTLQNICSMVCLIPILRSWDKQLESHICTRSTPKCMLPGIWVYVLAVIHPLYLNREDSTQMTALPVLAAPLSLGHLIWQVVQYFFIWSLPPLGGWQWGFLMTKKWGQLGLMMSCHANCQRTATIQYMPRTCGTQKTKQPKADVMK